MPEDRAAARSTEEELRRRLDHIEAELRSMRMFATAPYRSVVEDMTELVVRWRVDGVRVFVNDAYCRMFGASREDLLGTSFWPLVSDHDRSDVRERIRRLSPEKPVSTGVHRAYRPDGSEFWMEWTDRALFDEKWNIVEYQSVGRDITERMKLQEQLQRVVRADAVAKTSAAIAHDLANVFQVVEALSVLVGRDDLGRHMDSNAVRSVLRQGRALIEQLKNLTYGHECTASDVDLNKRIREAEGFLRLLGEGRVTLELHLSPDPCVVVGDPSQLDQVLLNLVRNAAEAATPGCRVRIETDCASAEHVDPRHVWSGDPPARCAVVRVRDDCGGIADSLLSSIFEPTITTKANGGGQGLATVTTIVRQHGGSVRAENVPGGALFEVVLPARG